MGQLGNAVSRRNGLSEGRAPQMVIQYKPPACNHTHRNNIIETEQDVFIYLGVCVPVCMFVTIKKKKP